MICATNLSLFILAVVASVITRATAAPTLAGAQESNRNTVSRSSSVVGREGYSSKAGSPSPVKSSYANQPSATYKTGEPSPSPKPTPSCLSILSKASAFDIQGAYSLAARSGNANYNNMTCDGPPKDSVVILAAVTDYVLVQDIYVASMYPPFVQMNGGSNVSWTPNAATISAHDGAANLTVTQSGGIQISTGDPCGSAFECVAGPCSTKYWANNESSYKPICSPPLVAPTQDVVGASLPSLMGVYKVTAWNGSLCPGAFIDVNETIVFYQIKEKLFGGDAYAPNYTRPTPTMVYPTQPYMQPTSTLIGGTWFTYTPTPYPYNPSMTGYPPQGSPYPTQYPSMTQYPPQGSGYPTQTYSASSGCYCPTGYIPATTKVSKGSQPTTSGKYGNGEPQYMCICLPVGTSKYGPTATSYRTEPTNQPKGSPASTNIGGTWYTYYLNPTTTGKREEPKMTSTFMSGKWFTYPVQATSQAYTKTPGPENTYKPSPGSSKVGGYEYVSSSKSVNYSGPKESPRSEPPKGTPAYPTKTPTVFGGSGTVYSYKSEPTNQPKGSPTSTLIGGTWYTWYKEPQTYGQPTAISLSGTVHTYAPTPYPSYPPQGTGYPPQYYPPTATACYCPPNTTPTGASRYGTTPAASVSKYASASRPSHSTVRITSTISRTSSRTSQHTTVRSSSTVSKHAPVTRTPTHPLSFPSTFTEFPDGDEGQQQSGCVCYAIGDPKSAGYTPYPNTQQKGTPTSTFFGGTWYTYYASPAPTQPQPPKPTSTYFNGTWYSYYPAQTTPPNSHPTDSPKSTLIGGTWYTWYPEPTTTWQQYPTQPYMQPTSTLISGVWYTYTPAPPPPFPSYPTGYPPQPYPTNACSCPPNTYPVTSMISKNAGVTKPAGTASSSTSPRLSFPSTFTEFPDGDSEMVMQCSCMPIPGVTTNSSTLYPPPGGGGPGPQMQMGPGPWYGLNALLLFNSDTAVVTPVSGSPMPLMGVFQPTVDNLLNLTLTDGTCTLSAVCVAGACGGYTWVHNGTATTMPTAPSYQTKT